MGNCTFGKLPLGKIPLGSCHLGKGLTSLETPYSRIVQQIPLYSGVLGNGLSMGYSAIAIPDIKQELLHHTANSTSLFDPIETSIEQLYWFGNAIF